MGPVGRTWRPKGGQWPPKCLPNASQIHRKLDSSVQPPPADHQNHQLAPNRLPNRRKIDLKVSPAHLEKLAIVAAFTGQDRRCVRGPRGKIRDSGPLTHSLHRKNITETFFFVSVPASLVPEFLPDFLLEFCTSLLACKHIMRCTPHCRTPKARWRFGPLAL